MIFRFQNVNDAFTGLIGWFVRAKESTVFNQGLNDVYGNPQVSINKTRNGEAIQINSPVIITYEQPSKRVLLNPKRDCNPFFHVYEAMWMLAGRNDLEPLKNFVSTFGDYSDDHKTLNGAYGYRWRQANTFTKSGKEIRGRQDQIETIIGHLKRQPNSRRAVLQMWNVTDDLLKVDTSKDVCCNLSVVFSIREEEKHTGDWDASFPTNKIPYLDMTVFNRSNDLVWGTLGANYVHFSFLQEYIARQLGVEIGRYHQVSNNLHVYLNDKWKPKEWLNCSYSLSDCNNVPLDADYDSIEAIETFAEYFSIARCESNYSTEEGFIGTTAVPMMLAFGNHTINNYKRAEEYLALIKDPEWRYVCCNWIAKRKMNKIKKGVKII